MRRETTNLVRYIIEELLPPIVRDTRAFGFLADAVIGGQASRFEEFRRKAPFLAARDYEELYRNYGHLHDAGDNTIACLDRIAQDVVGSDLCDVGCGGGQLLRHVGKLRRGMALTGVDIVLRDSLQTASDIRFIETPIENLPFDDASFDTVVCTHVLEHVLDIRRAVCELRRIARRRLIVVVPREREARFTFSPHFHFFPYKESFLRMLVKVPPGYACEYISRDIYYREDRAS